MAENQGIKGSQWSTLESGPLAQGERAENGQNQGIKGSQWSTLKSGPLARGEEAENGQNQGVQEASVAR